jgi:hypothetical protein
VGGTCGTHGKERKVYTVLLGKPLGRPRYRWEDGIRLDLGGLDAGV